MKITDVKVFPVNEERLKAYATIAFDDCFVVRDLKIIHGNSGLFVAMPSKKRKDGSFKDTAHPLNNETREMIESKVLLQYEEELRKVGVDPSTIGERREFQVKDDRREIRGEASRPSPQEVVEMKKPPESEEEDSAQKAPSEDGLGLAEDGDDLPADFESKV